MQSPNYIILDLEWNLPISKSRTVRNPILLSGEIIQIGAVKTDMDLNIIDKIDIMIKAKYYTKMNKFVTDLTLITDEDLKSGISFKEAITQFRQWCGDDCIWFTWGPEDIAMIKRNLTIHDMSCDWLPENFDAQLMFDDYVTCENRSFSLDYARFKFGIKGNLSHDALNDALATCEVMKRLDVNQWVIEEREYRQELLEYEDDYNTNPDEVCDDEEDQFMEES